MNREILAIIPARGGSQGIPRKNVLPLARVPLIAHSIHQARATPAIGRVVVSTDDGEIAGVARAWGAEVIERPAALASATASSESALRHSLETLAQDGYRPDLVVFLQATSPLRRRGEVQAAIDTLLGQGADSLFSATTAHGFVWRLHAGRLGALSYDPAARPRRQEIGEDLLENGSIYVFSPAVLLDSDNRLGGRIAVHRMHPLDSFQIDEAGDFELMEAVIALRRGELELASATAAPTTAELARIALLVFDFDGVMTDDRVLVDQDGKEAVFCSRSDGMGIERLRRDGLAMAVLSKETNPVVAARCRKLQLECHQGFDDKLPHLLALAEARGLSNAEVAFMGNDVNDLECMRWAGVSIAPADARPEALALARLRTERPGGLGAVREICDRMLAARTEARSAC